MDQQRGVIDRMVDHSVRLAAIISGLALLWLMGLTITAVVMRYAFNAPILGAQDLSQISLVVVVLPAMAYCGWTGGHVSLDLIGAVAGSATLRWVDSVVQMICGGFFLLLAWRTWERALDASQFNEATNLIEIPHAPFFFIIALSFALYALVLFLQAAKQLDRASAAR